MRLGLRHGAAGADVHVYCTNPSGKEGCGGNVWGKTDGKGGYSESAVVAQPRDTPGTWRSWVVVAGNRSATSCLKVVDP